MSIDPTRFDFSHLSVAERIDLVDLLWDSIAHDASPENFPLTALQKQELDSRLRAYDAGEMQGSSWEDVKQRVWKDQD
ncbi:MAG: addiction module protein [Alphaproteobacteria bacterium]|nr:addiction module protein [Alphaproteobacteria bacterium]